MINLPPDQLETVKGILKKFVPNRSVVVFGSRVTGKIKPYSDLDLCIMGEEPVEPGTMAALGEAFSESDLPIKVDLVDWADTSENFRHIIKDQAVPLE